MSKPLTSIADTQYFTAKEASAVIPGRPHKATILRWFDRGFNGAILESWRCGNKRVTSIEAIDKFFAATPGIPHRLTAQHKQAAQKLDEALA